jgi:outer membrane protein OmpA-like peptidoglycan-associated protein
MSSHPSTVFVLLAWLAWLTSTPSAAQEPPALWRADALFKRLATELDTVRAIDNHTHLRGRDAFNPELARERAPAVRLEVDG